MFQRNYKGINNPNYKHGKYCNIPKCIDCLKTLSRPDAIRCKSCSKKGKLNYLFKNSQKMNGENNPFFGKKHTKETKRKMRDKRLGKFKGRNSPRFGGKATHGKGDYYNNIWMRSSYEIAFAYFLDLSGINYFYEFKTFDLNNTTYTPDFYIPKWDLYIEIKGYWREKEKKKFRLFKKLYPNIKIKVLMKPELQELSIL